MIRVVFEHAQKLSIIQEKSELSATSLQISIKFLTFVYYLILDSCVIGALKVEFGLER